MRIAMVGHKRVPSREGGIEVVVEELAARMVMHGHSVTCYNRTGHHVSGKEYDIEHLDEYRGIRLKRVPTIDRKGLAAVTSSFFGCLAAAFGPYDVVHIHAEGPAMFSWLPRLTGKRVVLTVHGLDWARDKWKGSFGSWYIYDKRLLNCRSPYQGLYTILQTTDNAGISLRWFRDVFGDAVQQKAEAAGLSVYDYMNTLAEKVPAGCNGLVYLPYLAGEKSPIWDSDARGVFFGMSLSTDYGAFVRAIMEGVALSMRDCMEIMPAAKKSISPIPLGGGAANSRVWCQIFADVLNRPIVRLKSGETETLGDFIIAAESVGLTDVTRDFGKKLAAESEVLYPDSAAASVYDKAYQKYKAVYQNTKTLF